MNVYEQVMGTPKLFKMFLLSIFIRFHRSATRDKQVTFYHQGYKGRERKDFKA
jgi:hypothetical protein